MTYVTRLFCKSSFRKSLLIEIVDGHTKWDPVDDSAMSVVQMLNSSLCLSQIVDVGRTNDHEQISDFSWSCFRRESLPLSVFFHLFLLYIDDCMVYSYVSAFFAWIKLFWSTTRNINKEKPCSFAKPIVRAKPSETIFYFLPELHRPIAEFLDTCGFSFMNWSTSDAIWSSLLFTSWPKLDDTWRVLFHAFRKAEIQSIDVRIFKCPEFGACLIKSSSWVFEWVIEYPK